MSKLFVATRCLALTAVLCLTVSAVQSPPAVEAVKQQKIVNVCYIYTLTDLGEADVDPARLSLASKEPSLAPAINNLGQVIGNRAEGGFVIDPSTKEYAPYAHDVVIHFHAINNRGDLLVSYNRKTNPPEWMIWPTPSGSGERREVVNLSRYPAGVLALFGLTNDRKVFGNIVDKDKSYPVYWRPDGGMHRLRDCKGQLIEGRARAVNDDALLVGFFDKGGYDVPGAWSQSDGLTFLRNYRSKISPTADVQLIDIVPAPDGIVYGTYRISYREDPAKDQDVYYSYAWSPGGGGFKLLDLDNLRINAVNSSHVIVGSLAGKAAICRPGERPVVLSTIVKEEPGKEWELLEATGINDAGKIVGYGKLNGRMHIFLLDSR